MAVTCTLPSLRSWALSRSHGHNRVSIRVLSPIGRRASSVFSAISTRDIRGPDVSPESELAGFTESSTPEDDFFLEQV